METEYKILNQITPENANPYLAPAGYFEGLAGEVLFKIKTKQDTYSVPRNYFDSLSTSILTKIKQQENDTFNELQSVAPLLNTISKANIYSIPNRYFENIEIKKPTTVKVVSINKNTNRWIKYSAAAAIVGIVTVSALFLFKQTNDTHTDFQASLQNISDTVLSKAINNEKIVLASNEETTILPWQNLADLQNEIQFVTDEEMEDYIKDNNIIEDEANASNS